MAPNPVTPKDFPQTRWRGHWIWVPEEEIILGSPFPGDIPPPAEEAHGLFRKTFHLDQVPQRVPARITADSRYVLFANGQEVFRGPIRSQPRRMYYDFFDLAPYLKNGRNILAIYVKYYGTATSFWQPAVPNMKLGKSGIMVFEANLGHAGWIGSDDSWKAQKASAWHAAGNQGGVPIEIFDARAFPHLWREQAFDDSEWGQAQPVPAVHFGGFARTQPPTDPYGPLSPRPIAGLGGSLKQPVQLKTDYLSQAADESITNPVTCVAATAVFPVTRSAPDVLPLKMAIHAESCVRLVLDMGRIVSGLVEFEFDGPAGTILDLVYVEAPISGPLTHLDQHTGTRYIARGEADRFQVFDSNGFRFAYILVHGVVGQVTLTHFAVREHLYPTQTQTNFQCSDEALNRIFMAGIRTVQLCSQDAFIDCPTREQRAWVGDAVVHQMVHLATNPDWRLAWRYLTLSNSPRSDGILPMSVVGDIESTGCYTIPDWALHWVHGVYNLYRFKGDRELVSALMPTIEQILRWYASYQTPTGILQEVVEWNLVDWSSVHVEDTSSLINAHWARSLREFAEMAAWLEQKSSQRWAEERYEQIKNSFDLFWDEQRGSYIDHIVAGCPQPEMSQLAGALAIVSGLAPRERWDRIIAVITDPNRLVVRSWLGADGKYSEEKMAKQFRGLYQTDWDAQQQIVMAEPFMSYVVHDALAMSDQAERLPEMYRRWSAFLGDGYDTLGECWGWGTRVHGWSSTPTRDMIFYTLGVTPAEPGYTKASIAPRLGHLAWVKGEVPTPHGPIAVAATPDRVTVVSPIPFVIHLKGQPALHLPPGRHEL